ncbi:MAG: ParA family protein [Steroidobacteraceae bacterium]
MLQKIVVLNPKGGSGKTTLATNIAATFASQGLKPALMDMDAQGSSTQWLARRPADLPRVHAIAGYDRNPRVTRTFSMRVPMECERLVVDTPAAVDPQKLPELTRAASAIIVPVLPSAIDIHAAAKCIGDLLLIARIKRADRRIGVVVNRARRNTLIYRSLMLFLESLDIPVVTTLRDSQNFVRCAESGFGLCDVKERLVREDAEQWLPLMQWIAERPSIAAPAFPVASTGVHQILGNVPEAVLPGRQTPAVLPDFEVSIPVPATA